MEPVGEDEENTIVVEVTKAVGDPEHAKVLGEVTACFPDGAEVRWPDGMRDVYIWEGLQLHVS